MKKVLVSLLVTAFAIGLHAQMPESEAARASIRTGVVIGKADRGLTLWTKNGQEKFTFSRDVVLPQRKIKDGNLVAVFEETEGSRVAARVVLVDEEITVAGKSSRQRAVIGRTAAGRSPGHLVVRTLDGKEAFVIDPKTFRQPLPAPNQRVAVTYRVENVKPPIYKATGIVVLADQIEESPIKITYSPIPQPEPVVAEAPVPVFEPEPEPVLAELPQTGSPLPLVALLGLLLVSTGVVIRRSYVQF